MDKTLHKTPLFDAHVALGARMVPFADFQMPVQYSGVIEEAKNCRAKAGLFDVSHMGQFSFRGKRVIEQLQMLLTNNLGKLQTHQAQYNLLCNERGGVIDDVIVYKKSEEELFFCVNASNRLKDWTWMKEHLSKELVMEDQSDTLALIALQGPRSESILSSICPKTELSQLFYYWATPVVIEGVPIYLSRTGYTGEDGFELYIPAERAMFIWNILLEKGQPQGLSPCGLGARDTLRLEMGYPLHGHEISPEITPWEAGLSWVVKSDEIQNFIGKDALIKKRQSPLPRKLRGLRMSDKRIGRQGYVIAGIDQKAIGVITSGTFSPHLGAPIALGFMEPEASEKGNLLVQVRNDWVSAEATPLPFVPSKVKKR